MKPYDEDAECPKCGHGTVRTVFCEAGSWRSSHYHGEDTIHEKDVLLRVCERCTFHWDEVPLEVKEPPHA